MVHVLLVLTNVSCCVATTMESYRTASLSWGESLWCHLFTTTTTPDPVISLPVLFCLSQGVVSLETWILQPFLSTHCILSNTPGSFHNVLLCLDSSFYFYCWITLHCMDAPQFSHLPIKGHLDGFQFLTHTQNFEIYNFKVVRFYLWILLLLKHHPMLPWSEVQMAWSPPALTALPCFIPSHLQLLFFLFFHLPCWSWVSTFPASSSALCPDSSYPKSRCLDLSSSDTSSEKPSITERNPCCPITFLHKLLFWFSLVCFLLPEMVLSVCLFVTCLPTEHRTPSGSFLGHIDCPRTMPGVQETKNISGMSECFIPWYDFFNAPQIVSLTSTQITFTH